MQTAWFREFSVIARCQSISEAAGKLFMTHQSLSGHLKNMEREIGHELVERTVPLRLTRYGEAFLSAADDVAARCDTLRDEVRALEKSQFGTVVFLSYETPPFMSLLFATCRRMAERYPQVKIELPVCHGTSNEDAVAEGRVDVGFAACIGDDPFPPSPAWAQRFDAMELTAFRDTLFFGIPRGNPLYDKDEVTFDELLEQRIVVPSFDDRNFLLESLRALCDHEGRRLNVVTVSASNPAEVYSAPRTAGLHVLTATYLNSTLYRDFILPNIRLAVACDRDCSTRAFVFWRRDSANPALPCALEQLRQADAEMLAARGEG